MNLAVRARQLALTWREEAIDLGWLLAALATADRFVPSVALPGAAKAALLVVAALLLPHGRQDPARIWRGLAARLPAILGAAAAGAALFRLWFNLPSIDLAFAPIWAGLELLHRVVWRGYRAPAQAWGRRRLQARDDLWLGPGLVVGALLYLAGSFYPDFWSGPPGLRHAVALGWGGLALAGYRWALRRIRPRADAAAEHCRWLLLGAAALLLMRGFLRYTLHGAGDALGYGTMLADMLAQTRSGIFPVWVGQSLYRFNGAIYPLRVAPAFQYLGVLLDLLSLRTLGVFALQNLLLVLLGLAAIVSAYLTLGALLPGRRGLAAGFAVLFLACPGVLGIPYIADLFMSWTTLPLVPLVWFATVRSFRDRGSFGSMLLLGASLGLCWWGHSPIALWLTLFAGAVQGVRCLALRPDGPAWRHAAAGALAFVAIAAYPIGSVLFFPPDAGIDVASFQVTTPRTIAYFLGGPDVFPATFLPLSATGRQLGDFQLGYALWALLGFSLWSLRRIRKPETVALLVVAGLVVLVLLPIPGVNFALWAALPGFIRNPTGNWPMDRLYLVLAGAILYAVAASASELLSEPRRARALRAIVLLGCAWSLLEAAKFADGSRILAHPPASAQTMLRPEHVMLTRFSYVIFPRLPAYFTHGVADPELENRLWREPDGGLMADNLSAARAAGTVAGESEFSVGPPDVNCVETAPFPLAAGRKYLLAFTFFDPARVQGVLQVSGSFPPREYALPEYGEADSFGVGGSHPALLPVSTSDPAGENIRLRFFPDAALGAASGLLPFGEVTCLEYDPARLPVRVLSWMPYRARVRTPDAAWLETPRMFQRGYAARVDGRPAEVRKSAQGLVAIRVPAGDAEVELTYHPPPGLVILFWTSLAAVGIGGGMLSVRALRAAG